MNRYLVISVDTEADWFEFRTNRLSNIQGVNILENLCEKYGFLSTYFVTYEVATKEESLRILKPLADQNKIEIGHHMHIWSCPPLESSNEFGVQEDLLYGFQSEIGDDLFYSKMESLHQAIEENFQITPTSHRAGRWAIDNRTFNWLEKKKYLVDSSICNKKSWNYISKGISKRIELDTFHSGLLPYFPSKKDLLKSSEENYQFLEVPVSATANPFLNKSHGKFASYLSAFDSKYGLYKMGNTSFRPSYPISLKRYEKIVRKLFEQDRPVFNFMFHSSELWKGTSPYSKSEDLHRNLISRIELVLSLAKEYDIKGIKISDLHSNSSIYE